MRHAKCDQQRIRTGKDEPSSTWNEGEEEEWVWRISWTVGKHWQIHQSSELPPEAFTSPFSRRIPRSLWSQLYPSHGTLSSILWVCVRNTKIPFRSTAHSMSEARTIFFSRWISVEFWVMEFLVDDSDSELKFQLFRHLSWCFYHVVTDNENCVKIRLKNSKVRIFAWKSIFWFSLTQFHAPEIQLESRPS